MRAQRARRWGWAVLACAGAVLANEPSTPAVTAEMMPLASSRSIMLDVTETRARAIIVGERGHILLSESRTDWRQVAEVPTRATLTGVAAVGDKAWAVGHDGIILASSDGGQSWQIQRQDPWRPLADDEEFDIRQGVPLLDVLFVNENLGFAIGAYSLLLRTEDGGQHWTQIKLNAAPAEAAADPADSGAEAAADDAWTFDEDDLALDEESDPHLNGIARDGDGLLMMVAERGSAYRSTDQGLSWERLQLPYDGSMFGVINLGPGHFLAFGLRGHVLETRDSGNSWLEVDSGTEISLMGGAALADGGAVIVGANGLVLFRANADAPLSPHTFENSAGETPVLASVLPLGPRTFLLCGEKGPGRYDIPN